MFSGLSAERRGDSAMARTYREIAIQEMLRTVEEAMSQAINWWGDLPPPMKEAIEQLHSIAISHRRSPLERLRRCFVGRKETLESKLREGHVDRRAEHRRRAEEAQFSGVGDELEGDEHARAFIAGRRHEWFQ